MQEGIQIGAHVHLKEHGPDYISFYWLERTGPSVLHIGAPAHVPGIAGISVFMTPTQVQELAQKAMVYLANQSEDALLDELGEWFVKWRATATEDKAQAREEVTI